MSIIETGIAVFVGAAGVCAIVCGFTGLLRSTQRRSLKLLPGNQRPQRGAPATERSSAAQQILSSELARSTDAAELQLTRPIGGASQTSRRASMTQAVELLVLVQRLRREAARQGDSAGNRSAVSVSAPAAIRGAMDRTRGGADARPWRAAPAIPQAAHLLRH